MIKHTPGYGGGDEGGDKMVQIRLNGRLRKKFSSSESFDKSCKIRLGNSVK